MNWNPILQVKWAAVSREEEFKGYLLLMGRIGAEANGSLCGALPVGLGSPLTKCLKAREVQPTFSSACSRS